MARTSTPDGEHLCQIILKSIHNCRSYGPDKFGRTDGCMRKHTHTSNFSCYNFVLLTARRLDKSHDKKHVFEAISLNPHNNENKYMIFMLYNAHLQPFPKRQILDSSKLKEFADNNSKFDENGRKFSKMGRKHSGKRRNCSFQFLLFPQCFQKTCSADT